MENIKLTLRPATAAERHFAYAVPPEEQKASGSIGYLRGDFGSSGENFYHTWFDISPELKTQAFKDEFDQVVNALRFDPAYGKLMSSRDASRKYGWDHPESAIEGNYTTEFAFRADTEAHAYILRLNPTKGDYNFSFHAFVREALEQQLQGREQKAHQELRDLPVYRYPASYAREHGEMDQYRASRKTCIACKEAIEKAVNDNYHDNVLSHDAAKQIVDTYGFERTMYVLAVTIQHKDWDGRYSRSNKQWAREQQVFEDLSGSWDSTGAYVVDKCHPGLTDVFTTTVRHDYLLTQPLSDKDIQAEATRILNGFQSFSEPNSPNGTHYMVKVSDDFMFRARSQQTTKLAQYFPFQSFSISKLNDSKGVYAMIRKDEDRSKSLKEIKPSVRRKLKEKVPSNNSPKISANSEGPQRTSPKISAKLKETER